MDEAVWFAPQILVSNRTRTIGRTRTTTVATLVCPAGMAGGSCKVTAGRAVSVTAPVPKRTGHGPKKRKRR